MEIKYQKISFKGQLMSIALLIFVLLMVSSLVTLVIIEVGYDGISQSSIIASSSSNYGAVLSQNAKTFAYGSGTTALNTLFKYEYNVSLRKTNFITNFSQYMQYLIVNGSLPNVAKGSAAANALQSMMGNATLASYNSVVSSATGFGSKSIKVYESKPYIYQKNPYSIAIKYNEYVNINASTGSFAFTIPVNVSIPLNGTPDLFYAQQGIYRAIKPGNLNEQVSLIGNSYASSGNTLGYVYGTVYVLPYSSTCSSIPSPLNTQPYESQLIIADSNALAISGCTSYGGFISSNTISAQAMPYLSTTSTVFNYLQTGQKVLLYGPSLAILNITNLIDNVSSGAYFTSPFASSFSQRASGNIQQQSSSGIFTLSGIANRQAAQFNGATSNIVTASIPTSSSTLSVNVWVYPTNSDGSRGIVGQGNNGANSWDLKTFSGSGYDFVLYTTLDGSFTPINLNQWQMLTATYNSGILKLYVNGKMATSYTVSGSPSLQTNLPLYIGVDPGDVSPINFNGMISNIQVYNGVLSNLQIYSLYQQGIEDLPASNTGLIAWWPLNGNPNEYSGNGYTGSTNQVTYGLLPYYARDSAIGGNATATVNAIPGLSNCNTMAQCSSNSLQHLYLSNAPLGISTAGTTVAQFNGASSYISIPDSSALDPSSITVSVWVNIGASTGGCPGIVAKGGNSQYQIYQTSGTGVDPFVYTTAGLWDGFSTPGTLNTWAQYVFTYNSASGQMIPYYDGQAGSIATTSGGIASTSNPLYIGYMSGCGYFQGDIANLQIYSSALSANAIKSSYQEGITGAPVTIQNLAGWWPLNGNSNDYSGNGNNGVSTNVAFQYLGVPTASSSTNSIAINAGPNGGSVNSGWQTFGFGSPP